jgi:hypothetical protein
MRLSAFARAAVIAAVVASLAPVASAQEPPAGPNAVVAFIDTGINPYHRVFRDESPRAYQHPSTYIPGYPADAIALNITLDEETYWDSVSIDCEDVWKTVEPGKLYWFPGTKIVGAISFIPSTTPDCEIAEPKGTEVLDFGGHGTMVASRAASTEYGACKGCLVVAAQMVGSVNLTNPGPSTDQSLDPVRWAAANASWIDAQSNSWGPIAQFWEPTGATGIAGSNPEMVRTIEETSQKHMSFWASMNGVSGRYGVLGHPTLAASHLTPSAISVGGHDSGYVNTWPGFPPHLVSDSCSSWGAPWNKIEESGDSIGGGTSGATPFAAGGAGDILLEARRILGDSETGVGDDGVVARGPVGLVPDGPLADGIFTTAEAKQVLYKTATERPTAQYEDGPTCTRTNVNELPYRPTSVKWTSVPSQYPEYINIGYGAVDGPAKTLAFQVLRGEVSLPSRADTDQYFALDAQARAALHMVFRGPDQI